MQLQTNESPKTREDCRTIKISWNKKNHGIRFILVNENPWVCHNDMSSFIEEFKTTDKKIQKPSMETASDSNCPQGDYPTEVHFYSDPHIKFLPRSEKILKKIDDKTLLFIKKDVVFDLLQNKTSEQYATEIMTKLDKKLKKLVLPKKNHEDFIYIMTTENYENRNLFKIGRSQNPYSRLSCLNTGHCVDDKMEIKRQYRVPNAKIAEHRIAFILRSVRHHASREFYMGNFVKLDRVVRCVCENLENEYKLANRLF